MDKTPTKIAPEAGYTMSKKHRATENLHIVFWLFKDISWCIVFKPLGIAMIFPTLFVAIRIMWQNKSVASELYHNLAVMFWIVANSFWMISEFFHFDESLIFGIFIGKHFALIPFLMGIICLSNYYFFIAPKEKA